jgi:AraC-like DNA-binding protein
VYKRQIEGIRAGMDLVFPGSVDRKVLQVSLTGLMSERARLKEIYQLSDVPKSNGGEVTFDQFFLQRARKIVLNNYTNSDFNIEQFVKNMNVSRTMLYVKIKQLTGYTTSEFVRGIRMEEAARLLKEGMLNVSEVAFKVGFKDPKYLSKKFKLCYGITPSDFRRGGLKSI